MMLQSWIRNVSSRTPRRALEWSRKAPARLRPRLEALEDRCLPSAGVLGAVVNNDPSSLQRSMVTNLEVTFTSTITLDAGAISIKHTSGSAAGNFVGLDIQTTTIIANGVPATQATLRFTGSDIIGSSLTDGDYELHVDYTKVHFTDGRPTDPSDFTYDFFRLFGDVNGDGRVAASEVAFAAHHVGTSSGDADYIWYLDYDANGAIDGYDHSQLAQRHDERSVHNPTQTAA